MMSRMFCAQWLKVGVQKKNRIQFDHDIECDIITYNLTYINRNLGFTFRAPFRCTQKPHEVMKHCCQRKKKKIIPEQNDHCDRFCDILKNDNTWVV